MKNKIALSVMSLSLLMGTLPIKAEDSSDVRKDIRKILRCCWHLTKIGTGIGCSLTGIGCFAYSKLAKTAFFKNAEDDLCRPLTDDEKRRIEVMLHLDTQTKWAARFATILFIPGVAAIKSGVDGLRHEFSDEEEE